MVKKTKREKAREIYLIGDIEKETMRRVTEEILELHEQDPAAKISLYITSGGGNPQLAIGFYELIRIKKIPLVTIGMGDCSSSALIVLLAGSERKATRNTIFEVHEIAKSFEQGESLSILEIESLIESTKKLDRTIMKIAANNIGEKIDKMKKIRKKGITLTAEEAKKLGLISEII